jgi:hypothetical protein
MSASKASCRRKYERDVAKIRTYDIVASSIINLRAARGTCDWCLILIMPLCSPRTRFPTPA